MVWVDHLPISSDLQDALAAWAAAVDVSDLDDAVAATELWQHGRELHSRLEVELAGSRFAVHWDAGELDDWLVD